MCAIIVENTNFDQLVRHEREEGHKASADAVLEGLHDLAVRQFGIYRPKRRWAVPVLRSVFEIARRVKPPRNGDGSPVDARKDLWDGRTKA